ncbi:hypothetical protein Bca52824_065298 [Brassica carinata]|uniref:Uncharacterized protein n=1 Tax=Brassica carinata TaxID=52824 RepID=A0A8X7QJ56_BRACI|nr:hypothetical protein Bca52824_065298 [Brassica carinata]
MFREALGVPVGEIGEASRGSSIPSPSWRVMFGGLEEVKQNAADLDSRFIRSRSWWGSMQALRDDIEG